MRIAVVGTGISGSLAARLLSTEHQIEVFEASSHIGGHANTAHVLAYGRRVSADVAFMVLNRRTYPHFCSLLDQLGVETQDSDMSLSVRCCESGLEFQGSSLNGIFAQRRNLLRPSFYRMLRDIVRFNRLATSFCAEGDSDEALLLGEFLDDASLGHEFRQHYLIPMSAAIWSAEPSKLYEFPAKFILGFLRNHGLLQLKDRPQWLTVAKRSEAYVAELTGPFRESIHVDTPVTSVHRASEGVKLQFASREPEHFDHVVLACHADQSLAMLEDASATEREVLSGFPYQRNSAVLHTDHSTLPRRKRAWASWNYHIPAESADRVSVTYDLNRLQNLGLPGPLCLTLNPTSEIDPRKVIKQFEFQHPVFA